MIGSLFGATLAGCTSMVSEADYALLREALRDQEMRQEIYRSCVEDDMNLTEAEGEAMAVILRTTPAKLDSVICTRLLGGVRSGRLSYEEYRDFKTGRNTAPALRILTGQ